MKCKAAACRQLAPFLVFLANRHKRVGYTFEEPRLVEYSGEYRDTAVELAVFIEGYHQSCQAEPFDVPRCLQQMLGFLDRFSKLRLLFRRGLPADLHAAQPFGGRPKFHLSDHLVMLKVPMYGTPRLFWCYGDEDFVGLVKRIAVQTRHPATMESPALAKYRLLSALHAYALSVV